MLVILQTFGASALCPTPSNAKTWNCFYDIMILFFLDQSRSRRTERNSSVVETNVTISVD
jgi:hypothetical protein